MPNQITIEGHTDAVRYNPTASYTNWELSADRANAARRLMQTRGVGLKQIAEVRGFADQHLRLPDRPQDPANRRITLIVHAETTTSSPGGSETERHAETPRAGAAGRETAHAEMPVVGSE